MLVRFDPFRQFDRARTVPLSAVRRGEQLIVSFDLPGVSPESIDVTVERNQLTVTAERTLDHADGDVWLIAERPAGRFTRQLILGENLDTDRIEADYHDGVLVVTIPVAEQAKPRKIAVGVGGNNGTVPEAIEATSSES